MTMPKVKITKITTTAKTPVFQTKGAAGCDVHADLISPLTIYSGQVTTISTGLCMEIPEGFEAQVRPRSGLSLKTHLRVANSPGTIDSDYRGEIKIILENTGIVPEIIHPNDRIAQLVFAEIYQPDFEVLDTLSCTERGAGGFGSTGTKST